MNKSTWIVVLIVVLMLAATGQAEIYKYIDENGKRRWTDDLSQVPNDQRPAPQRLTDEEAGQPADRPPVLQSQPIPEHVSQPTATAAPQDTAKPNRETLLKEKAALHELYRQLMLERQQIQQALAESSNTADRATIRRRAQAYNQKADAYDDRLDAFNQKVAAYKQSVTAVQVQVAE